MINKNMDKLKKSMEKYKDTVFIVQEDKTKLAYSEEDYKNNYNRKCYKRDPYRLYSFFFNFIYNNNNDTTIEDLLYKLKDFNISIINLNTTCKFNKDLNVINIHGNQDLFKCQKCNIVYSSASVDKENYSCDVCGEVLKPDVLLCGERYNEDKYNEMRKLILESHNVFLINYDFSEEAINLILKDYAEIRNQGDVLNREIVDKTPEKEKDLDERSLTLLKIKEDFDPNEIVFFDFLTEEDTDVSNGLKRFIDLILK